jgi:hypothetical protein
MEFYYRRVEQKFRLCNYIFNRLTFASVRDEPNAIPDAYLLRVYILNKFKASPQQSLVCLQD